MHRWREKLSRCSASYLLLLSATILLAADATSGHGEDLPPPKTPHHRQQLRHAAGLFYFSTNVLGNGHGGDRRITKQGWITEEGEDMMGDAIGGNVADCSIYPNGTDAQPYAYSCDATTSGGFFNKPRPPILLVHETAFSNKSGDYQYPLDFRQTLRIFLDATNYAIQQFDSIRAEVSFYRRRTGWMGCGWIYLPTFGSLDNLDICDDPDNAVNCPAYPGRQVLEVKVKPNRLFTGFVKMVHDDRVPYQLKMRLFNNRQMGEELLCVVFQARMKI